MGRTRLVKTFLAAAALAALAGCNTVQGFGRDLQIGGGAIAESAQTAKRGF